MKSLLYLLFTVILIVSSSCKKDDNQLIDEPDYTIPTTYNFDNVSYSGQIQRIGMLNEMKAYMGSANTSGTSLDASKLAAMYTNDAASAGWVKTYEDSKQLRNKTFEPVQATFDELISNIALASQSTVAGVDGTAGVVTSNDGAKNYLFDEKGVELAQLVEKGLMGALLYYQSTAVYFGSNKIDSDNETVTEGRGTEMEHAFDEAFGYFGVPIDFPMNKDNIIFWGNYCNRRNDLLGSNHIMMDAFLKGRAAISNNDLTTRDEAIKEIRDTWELVVATTALHYINSGINNFSDNAIRGHALSEAIAFIYSLQFNPTKRVTNDQVEELLILIGGSADILASNLYNTTEANLQVAKAKLAEWYDVVDQMDEF